MKLPCRHIFALRKQLKHPLHCETLCSQRWTKYYYLSCHRVFDSCKEPSVNPIDDWEDELQNVSIIVEECKKRKVLSQHEKYRKAFGVAQKLASIASEASKSRFNTLQQILGTLQAEKEVTGKIGDGKDYTEENTPSSFPDTHQESLLNDDSSPKSPPKDSNLLQDENYCHE